MARSVHPTRSMLAAIGEVAAESAILEHRLRDLFTHLIDSPYGAVITSGEDMSHVAQMCLRVAQYNHRLDDSALDELVRILKAVETLRPLRNFIVHARWEKLSAPGEHAGIRSSRAAVRPNDRGLDEFSVWTVDGVLQLGGHIRAVVEWLDQYMDRTFESQSHAYLVSRTSQAKMEAFFARIGWPPEERDSPTQPSAD